jgi:hypothetical protein
MSGCMIRVCPGPRRKGLVSFEEYALDWVPCEGNVVFEAREPLAPGGVMRLCQWHYDRLSEAFNKPFHSVVSVV